MECETCREMAILAGSLWRKSTYTSTEVEDMVNHILNGHSAQVVIDKFGIK